MATKYIHKFASTADLLARAADRTLQQGIGFVAGILTANISGSAVQIVDQSSAQTLTNKRIDGVQQYAGATGADGSQTVLSNPKTLTDNTATDFFTVTIPNVIAGGAVDIFVTSTLGDGDSTDSAFYTVAISRIAGAATKAVMSSKSVVGATAGATANAVITGSVSSISGANGATQTFTIQFKNARSAGSATNHKSVAVAQLACNVGGITIAAA